jgi:hypothetical protein
VLVNLPAIVSRVQGGLLVEDLASFLSSLMTVM